MPTPEEIAAQQAEAARLAAERATREAEHQNMARGKPDTFNDNKAGKDSDLIKKK
jgi:hypothetical protein